MMHTLHDYSYALRGCHCYVFWEYHRLNVNAQNKETIFHLECTTFYIIVSMFDVKLN